MSNDQRHRVRVKDVACSNFSEEEGWAMPATGGGWLVDFDSGEGGMWYNDNELDFIDEDEFPPGTKVRHVQSGQTGIVKGVRPLTLAPTPGHYVDRDGGGRTIWHDINLEKVEEEPACDTTSEVGVATVKVVPDTTQFERMLRELADVMEKYRG